MSKKFKHLNNRPFLSFEKVERVCKEALSSVDLYPEEPEPIRIERFLEKKFNITPEYNDIDSNILGFTGFGPKGAEKIVVSKEILVSSKQSNRRRVNTTLAHEAGHCLFHESFLSGDGSGQSLFENIKGSQAIACREISGINNSSYNGEWWEYQANMSIGSLLLPASLVKKAIKPYLIDSESVIASEKLDTKKRREAARHLSDVFNVNPVVAKIRLNKLYPESESGQMTL